MKRSPLKRSPMKRSSMKRSAPPIMSKNRNLEPGTKSKNRKSAPKHKTKYALRERDYDYMKWVTCQPCLLSDVEEAGPCSGIVEADHAGDRGMGQKAPDDTCIPLCSAHHLDRHACTGYFRGRPKPWKREWRHSSIAKVQSEYEKVNYDFIAGDP